MSKHSITVLMATYQGKKYLEQQLDSILTQTVPVKILISDDGSTDGMRELLEKYRRWYPDQIQLCHRPRCGEGMLEKKTSNSIPPAAQNFFWLLSQAGEDSGYIMLSDQDDVWFNHKVKRLLKRIKALEQQLGEEEPILVYSDMEVVNSRLEQIAPSFFKYQKVNPRRKKLEEVLVENPVTGGAILMNQTLLKLVAGTYSGKLPESCVMHDWWIALTAACFGTISCVCEPLYQYRQHGSNTMGAKKTGSLQDIKARPGRSREISENYQKIFRQAKAFFNQFGGVMPSKERKILKEFIKLQEKSPMGRMGTIFRYGFKKSSLLQTLAMSFTMPKQ